MKKYFSLFYKKSPSFFLIISAIGILNSALNSALMIVVSRSINNPRSLLFNTNHLFLFFGVFIACILFNLLFYSYMTKLSSGIVCEVEMDIVQRIRSTSFRNFGCIRNEEIYAAFRNINILREAPGKLVNILISLLSIVGCVGYLFYVSTLCGVIITVLIGLTIYGYFRQQMLNGEFRIIRELQVEYYQQLGDLLLGFKDLKMSSLKSRSLYTDFIARNRQESRDWDTKFRYRQWKTVLMINYAWYFFLGVILFVLPRWAQVSLAIPSVFAVVLVYLLGPVTNITGVFPFLVDLKFAVEILEALKFRLSKEVEKEFDGKVIAGMEDFVSLRFHEIEFEYIDEQNRKVFYLGPINLEFNTGELVFLIGGNGSGKTTFLNILTGLQKPSGGSVYYNEQLISDDTYAAYRNKIAAIFSDGYLLQNNYGSLGVGQHNEKFVRYLKEMKLDQVIPVDDIFRRKASLSKGQQKRLLLVLSLLMDKDILVWDEWEAEQDPVFKHQFYRHVIPFLKSEGKTIIAITHDDRYLSCADRIIKFRDGKVVDGADMESLYPVSASSRL